MHTKQNSINSKAQVQNQNKPPMAASDLNGNTKINSQKKISKNINSK